MTENTLIFQELAEKVINQLKEQHYKDSSLDIYRRIYNRVFQFMEQNGISEYTAETGKAFLDITNVSKSTFASYSCAVRRLNDYITGKPYRCHRSSLKDEVLEIYGDILQGYLEKCSEDGNKQATLSIKSRSCTLFLKYIEQLGYTDISSLNTEIISKALLIYSNKDNYAIIRMFLKYLYAEDYTKQDFSGIVPHYKRRSTIPTTYTIEEIIHVEDSVDTTTDTGKRDLAIIRLATRMGLRAGDIAKLKRKEINLQDGYISLCQEKTGILLTLQMPDEVIDALIQHLKNMNPVLQGDDYVFHSMAAPYGPITTSIIRHTVTSHLNAAKINTAGRKHGPHAFRSSLASSMVNDGVSYETVRKILGHSDPNVIKHYAKVDMENLRICALAPPVPCGIFKDYLSGKKVVRHV